jgi:hypothetical protein
MQPGVVTGTGWKLRTSMPVIWSVVMGGRGSAEAGGDDEDEDEDDAARAAVSRDHVKMPAPATAASSVTDATPVSVRSTSVRPPAERGRDVLPFPAQCWTQAAVTVKAADDDEEGV